jgi:hypothetical protein
MQERSREQTRTRHSSGQPGSLFDDGPQDGAGGLVTVVHAPYAEALPVGEMSIAMVRDRFRDRLDIHPEAVAFVDGNPAGDDTIVHEGQRLMFMRPAGEKGIAGCRR